MGKKSQRYERNEPPEVNPSPHQRDVNVKRERILSAADIVQSKLKN